VSERYGKYIISQTNKNALLISVAAGGFLGDTANTVEASTNLTYLASFI
jgi:hypothetical protein